MARLPRMVVAGLAHLVVQRTLSGCTAFADDEDLQRFLQALRAALAAENVQLHAHGVRGDELRLLVRPAGAAALARLMQSIGRNYVAAYNRRHDRRGPLWEGRFHACVVEPGEPVLAAMAWVVAAGEGGMASSAGHHAGLQRDRLVTDPPAYWALGNTPFAREAAWRDYRAAGLPRGREAKLLAAVQRGWAFGSADFIARIAQAAGRPAAPRPRGRPRRRP